jgi:6,7-dimethyl-8-ribityllumazine synthase
VVKIYQGKLMAKGLKFALVVGRFNEFISQRLLEGALDTLERQGANSQDIKVIWVPGSFEISSVAHKLARSKKHHALICLGAVIRGDTPHFNYIASELAKGISQVSLTTGVPTIFGVITADTIEQAIERAGTKAGNKGRDAALAAIEMANLFKEIDKK